MQRVFDFLDRIFWDRIFFGGLLFCPDGKAAHHRLRTPPSYKADPFFSKAPASEDCLSPVSGQEEEVETFASIFIR
jgi:hypothetical protein